LLIVRPPKYKRLRREHIGGVSPVCVCACVRECVSVDRDINIIIATFCVCVCVCVCAKSVRCTEITSIGLHSGRQEQHVRNRSVDAELCVGFLLAAAAAAGRFGLAVAPLPSPPWAITKWWSGLSDDNVVRPYKGFDFSFSVAEWPKEPPWPLDLGAPGRPPAIAVLLLLLLLLLL